MSGVTFHFVLNIFKTRLIFQCWRPKTYITREGVIIKCTLNGLFHDACDIIITSQMAIRELDDDDDNDKQTLL